MEVDNVVSQFDELYNDVLKKDQMDLHVRYLDSITTRDYISQFLGKAASKNVLEKFKQCMSGIDRDKLLQVSMNGSDVNTSFLWMLPKQRAKRGGTFWRGVYWKLWLAYSSQFIQTWRKFN